MAPVTHFEPMESVEFRNKSEMKLLCIILGEDTKRTGRSKLIGLHLLKGKQNHVGLMILLLMSSHAC